MLLALGLILVAETSEQHGELIRGGSELVPKLTNLTHDLMICS